MNMKSLPLLFFLVMILVLASCGKVPETAAPLPPEIAPLAPPQTSTPQPTLIPTAPPTAEPTPTLEPSPTATLGVVENGFSAWCLPNDVYLPEHGYSMPEVGVPSRLVDDVTEIDGMVQSCTFVYTFTQPIPEGLQLALFDTRPEAWFYYPIITAPDNPNIGYVYIDHQYVVNLPYWQVDYRFELQDQTGSVLRSDVVRILRPQNVGYCFGGTLPDPITLKCEFLGEAHPWDPWYGWDLDPKMP